MRETRIPNEIVLTVVLCVPKGTNHWRNENDKNAERKNRIKKKMKQKKAIKVCDTCVLLLEKWRESRLYANYVKWVDFIFHKE